MKSAIDPRDINVDALLAAINEISESEIHRSSNDPHHVSVDGREYHTWRELAGAGCSRLQRDRSDALKVKKSRHICVGINLAEARSIEIFVTSGNLTW